ncbi:cobalamin-binding protein [Bacillus lacus]|uniref:Cobalamin-binding protein n=1 Tax=Metabacillus lacus TaxID=1983721 RepID=A0A7X2IYM4_9BACI|nr:cobalamin-dependent protein [Metabacillus lacus]MRX71548.1 cobalamin-binding protein [Metabacillus lacus]
MNQQVKTLASLLLAGDTEEAWKLVLTEYQDGKTSLQLYEELFTRAMQYIGELWETDDISVADEHLATTTCDYLLSRYAYLLKKRSYFVNNDEKIKRNAMFFCLQDEQHYLGLKMASLVFEERGWETQLHGANLPLEDAIQTAEEAKPEVILLSFTLLYHAEKLSSYVRELEALPHKPAIVVGGRLLPKYDFRKYCSENTKLLSSLSDLDSWIAAEFGHGVKMDVND